MSAHISDKTFIDKETGAEVSGAVKVVECERDNFDIVYIMNFCDLFDMIGGKKYRIVKYLLQNRNSENQVITTSRELAAGAEVSLSTVTQTLKILKSFGVISTRTGVIRINPKMIVHGDKKKENWIFTKFIAEREKATRNKP